MNKIFAFPVRLNRHQQTAEKQKSVSMQFVSNYKRKLIRNGKWKSNNEATRWGKKLKNSIRYFCNLITRFHHQNEIKSHFSLFIAFNYKKLPVKLDCLSVCLKAWKAPQKLSFRICRFLLRLPFRKQREANHILILHNFHFEIRQ